MVVSGRSIHRKVPGKFSFADLTYIVSRTIAAGARNPTKVTARIKHLQRLGIPARSPGRGSKKPYDSMEVIEVAVCFQLIEAGIDPSVAVDLIREHRDGPKMVAMTTLEVEKLNDEHGLVKIPAFIDHEEMRRKSRYVWFQPTLSTYYWDEDYREGIIKLEFGDQAKLEKRMSEPCLRLTVINLGMLARLFHTAVVANAEKEHGIDP